MRKLLLKKIDKLKELKKLDKMIKILKMRQGNLKKINV